MLGGALAVEPEGLRIQLLGGFRVWVGARAAPEAAWRRRKAASLVKLLGPSLVQLHSKPFGRRIARRSS